MKSFKSYLTEFAMQSTSDYVFDVPGGQGAGASGLKIPISGPMMKRIWPDTIRSTVFHATDLSGLKKLKRIEGGKKSISAFYSMMARYMEKGIATRGGLVVEMDADTLVSASSDIMSEVDKTGRRWVEMSWFANAQRYGTGPKFAVVERELNDLIRNLVLKHLEPILGNKARTEFEFDLWADMKRHLKGDGKKLRLVIKDYFDGVEKVLKKHEKTMSSIFYGYARSKRQTEDSWDEQIVNNIKIKKIHVLEVKEYLDDEGIHDDVKSVGNWPIEEWDSSIELEVYTREVVAAERKK